jgi:hypothetical protein
MNEEQFQNTEIVNMKDEEYEKAFPTKMKPSGEIEEEEDEDDSGEEDKKPTLVN